MLSYLNINKNGQVKKNFALQISHIYQNSKDKKQQNDIDLQAKLETITFYWHKENLNLLKRKK